MFRFQKTKNTENYIEEASRYLQEHYIKQSPVPEEKIKADQKPEKKNSGHSDGAMSEVKYSSRDYRLEPNLDALPYEMGKCTASQNYSDLSAWLDKNKNDTFVDFVTTHIRKYALKDSQVYKSANLDRRLFSKMMSDRNYKPSKDTAIAVAIGLKLSLTETQELLSRAGYTLSHSSRRDIIIEYFIQKSQYSIIEMNAVLEHMNEKIIGR